MLTAALLLFAAPQFVGSRIVREGMLADPQILPDTADALRDAQYAPTLAANRAALETPFGRRGKAPPSPTSCWSNSSITPALIAKRSNPHRRPAAERG